jgi:hypothetical protein
MTQSAHFAQTATTAGVSCRIENALNASPSFARFFIAIEHQAHMAAGSKSSEGAGNNISCYPKTSAL